MLLLSMLAFFKHFSEAKVLSIFGAFLVVISRKIIFLLGDEKKRIYVQQQSTTTNNVLEIVNCFLFLATYMISRIMFFWAVLMNLYTLLMLLLTHLNVFVIAS